MKRPVLIVGWEEGDSIVVPHGSGWKVMGSEALEALAVHARSRIDGETPRYTNETAVHLDEALKFVIRTVESAPG